jgi:hypothetical protein
LVANLVHNLPKIGPIEVLHGFVLCGLPDVPIAA